MPTNAPTPTPWNLRVGASASSHIPRAQFQSQSSRFYPMRGWLSATRLGSKRKTCFQYILSRNCLSLSLPNTWIYAPPPLPFFEAHTRTVACSAPLGITAPSSGEQMADCTGSSRNAGLSFGSGTARGGGDNIRVKTIGNNHHHSQQQQQQQPLLKCQVCPRKKAEKIYTKVFFFKIYLEANSGVHFKQVTEQLNTYCTQRSHGFCKSPPPNFKALPAYIICSSQTLLNTMN